MPSTPAVDHRPLVERVRPTRVEDVAGDSDAIGEVLDWARTWAASDRPPRYRALLLSGPPGVGKTTLAAAVARSFGWTIVEMNASEARNQAAIEEVAGRAALTHTLGDSGTFRSAREGGRTLILLDEADSMAGRADAPAASKAPVRSFREFLVARYRDLASLKAAWDLGRDGRPDAPEAWTEIPLSGGRGPLTRLPEVQRDLAEWKGSTKRTDLSDRGGYGAAVRLVKESRQPVILTANDDRELFRRAPALRALVAHVRLEPLGSPAIAKFVRNIATRERISLEPNVIEAIVRRSRGDLRAALNDLEAVAPLPSSAAAALLGFRDRHEEIERLVGDVLREPRVWRSVELRDRAESNPEELWPWFEENLPRFAPSEVATARGLERLVRAELQIARARRQRVYALWSFAGEVMAGGGSLAIAADGPARSSRVAFPEFLGLMGRSRFARATRDSVLAKGSAAIHVSRRKGTEVLGPWLAELLRAAARGQGPPGLARAIARDLGMTAEEVEFFGGDPSEVALAEEPSEDPPVEVAPSPEPTPEPGRTSRTVQRKL